MSARSAGTPGPGPAKASGKAPVKPHVKAGATTGTVSGRGAPSSGNGNNKTEGPKGAGGQRTMRRAVSDEDKIRRRNELLDAAKRVFAEKGYHETTMADVARRAGLSYGVAYWYFESKDDLFKAMMTAEEEALRSRIAEALAEAHAGSLRSALEQGVRATYEFIDADRDSAQLLFREPHLLGDDFERHLFGIYGRFVEDIHIAVQRGQDAGAVREAPPRMVAFAIASLISQLALRRLRHDDGLNSEEAARFTVDFVFDGLAPR